jgi:anti-sigma factor RsiW
MSEEWNGIESAGDYLWRLKQDNARLEAENRALRSALAPFARASQQVQERRERYLWTDDTPLLIPITVGRSLEVTASVGDLRRAATVLEKRGE